MPLRPIPRFPDAVPSPCATSRVRANSRSQPARTSRSAHAARPLQHGLPAIPPLPLRRQRSSTRRTRVSMYVVAGTRLPVVDRGRPLSTHEPVDQVDGTDPATTEREQTLERLLGRWLMARSWLDRALDRLAEATGCYERLGSVPPLGTRWSQLPPSAWLELRTRVERMSRQRRSDPSAMLEWLDAVSSYLQQFTDYRLGQWCGIDTSPSSVEPSARWVQRATLTPGGPYTDCVRIVSFAQLQAQHDRLDALVDQCAGISQLLQVEP